MHKAKEWYCPCTSVDGTTRNRDHAGKEVMLNVAVENIGEMAVVECEGRLIHSESAHKLREAVTLQTDARIVILDLSAVSAVGGVGFDMLVFLRRWAQEHNIRFLVFDPSKSVQSKLNRARSSAEFYIPSFEEMMAILACANSRYALAA
jgi:anti-anti-sigma regulatory factor